MRHVFVLAMENHGALDVYDKPTVAPYLDSVSHSGARADNFHDALADNVVSEPHYVTLEAGTNRFDDRRFCTDNDPGSLLARPTSSHKHLTAQMAVASPAVSWLTYQEGITAGQCPVHGSKSAHYAPKHDPFLFFADVVGATPTSNATVCVEHHHPYSDLATDLAHDHVAQYVFITPI